MTLEYQSPGISSRKASVVPSIIGWTLSVLVSLLMGVMPMVMMLTAPEKMTEGATMYGYPDGTMKVLAIVEIASVVLFLIPHTSMIGAILLTAYLGGAVATHVQGPLPQPGAAPTGEPYWFPILFGVVIWIALLLREPRLRTLLPIRR
jgi:hypothetical protein